MPTTTTSPLSFFSPSIIPSLPTTNSFLILSLLWSSWLCQSFFTAAAAATSNTPSGRTGQAAVLDTTSKKVVFLGGSDSSGRLLSDVVTLDLQNLNRTSVTGWQSGVSLATATSDAAVVRNSTSGDTFLIGGDVASGTNCSSASISVQSLTHNATSWSSVKTSGSAPSVRRGAGAFVRGGSIRLFGGKSPASCASQYYYNAMYDLDLSTVKWNVTPTTNPPVAEADFALTYTGDGDVLVLGGESAGQDAKASWLSWDQLALFRGNTSSWNYVSASAPSTATGSVAVAASAIGARSGHTAVSNGSSVFVLGGSLGNSSTTAVSPTFFRIDNPITAPTYVPIALRGDNIPPAGLNGHSAVMTPDGVMVVAFGTVNGTTYNDQIFLYDTVENRWLVSYSYSVPKPLTAAKSAGGGTGGLSGGALAGIIIAVILNVVICSAVAIWWYRRRHLNKRRSNAVHEKFARFDTDESLDRGDHHHGPSPADDGFSDRLQLPPWASMHVCQARSVSPEPLTGTNDGSRIAGGGQDLRRDRTVRSLDEMVMSSCTSAAAQSRSGDHGGRLSTDEGTAAQMEIDRRMVQLASPPSPKLVAFTAPRMKLRVTNPSGPSRTPSVATTIGRKTSLSRITSAPPAMPVPLVPAGVPRPLPAAPLSYPIREPSRKSPPQRQTSTTSVRSESSMAGMPLGISSEDDLDALRSRALPKLQLQLEDDLYESLQASLDDL